MRHSLSSFLNKGWLVLAVLGLTGICADAGFSAPVSGSERDPVTLKVVVVNPSADKVQQIPIRMDLPQEITPKDILENGGLQLEYDEDKSVHYMFKDSVELAPKETKVFEVVVRDIWFVQDGELDKLGSYTQLILGKLEKTEFFKAGKELADGITARLEEIRATQGDETLSRKTRIGAYRLHLQKIAQVKEDLAKMEKLLTFTGGPPVPEMLEESKLKSDAPSTKTTWIVIFMIMIFLGLLGGLFFFTWHSRIRQAQEFANVKELSFPEGSSPTEGNGASHPSDASKGKAA